MQKQEQQAEVVQPAETKQEEKDTDKKE